MGHEFEPLSGQIIEAAIAVHRELGPGFLESIYEAAMAAALRHRGIPFETQKEVTVLFEGEEVDSWSSESSCDARRPTGLLNLFRVFVLSCFRDPLARHRHLWCGPESTRPGWSNSDHRQRWLALFSRKHEGTKTRRRGAKHLRFANADEILRFAQDDEALRSG